MKKTWIEGPFSNEGGLKMRKYKYGIGAIVVIIIILLLLPTIYTNIYYDRNPLGKTYGKSASQIDKTGFLQDPDLIKVRISESGKTGYLKKEDIQLCQPNTPEEAGIYMESLSNISVYENDGVTVIAKVNLNNSTSIIY